MIKTFLGFSFFLLLVGLVLGFPLDTYDKVLPFLGAIILSLFAKPTWSFKRLTASALLVLFIIAAKSIPLWQVSYIEEGGSVFVGNQSNFKDLPTPLYTYLEKEFNKLYPHHVLEAENNLYAFSVEQFYLPSSLSRKKEYVKYNSIHELRFGSFNHNRYNTYGTERLPPREQLPFYMRYEVPASLAQDPRTQICWQGDLFYSSSKGDFLHEFSQDLCCLSVSQHISPQTNDPYIFYAVQIHPDKPLKLEIKTSSSQKWAILITHFLGILGAFLVTFFLFAPSTIKPNLEQLSSKRHQAIILCLSLIVSCLVAYLYRPNSVYGFVLFEGGNDGLTYETAARTILEALYHKDWHNFFLGYEQVYMLMPWHRYFYALNLLLFGETHFGYFLLVCFFPLVIYRLVRVYFQSEKWAFILSLSFVIFPIFESFGFAQFYMVRLCMRGFSEPLSYFFFFLGLSFGPFLLSSSENKGSSSFLSALFLCLAVGIRPNLILGASMYLLWLTCCFFKGKDIKSFLALCLGFSPILLIPLHNWYFGNVFVPLTASANIPENLALLPSDYYSVLQKLFSFKWPQEELIKIMQHLNGEVPFKRFWAYIALGITLWGAFSKHISSSTRMLASIGLFAFTITFFYHVGGRYSYAHWILILLSTLLILKETHFLRGSKKYAPTY